MTLSKMPEPNEFGKVALLMGGWSAEREISLRSGNAVLSALRRAGVNVVPVDVGRDVIKVLQSGGFDRVFNMLHGRGGEDGTIQALLELLELPYTGSGMLGCAIAMDKFRTKALWAGLGLPTPAYMLLNNEADCAEAATRLGFPLAVKPVFEGSSIGITKVEQKSHLPAAWRSAQQYGPVLAEQWIEGEEYTTGVLENRALPLIRLETTRTFYDYDAKYNNPDTQYHCPCGLDVSRETELQKLSEQAFLAVNASGWGRVDLMLDSAQRPWLIEVNTVPGMTDHSLVPMAAKVAGINFDELVLRILATSLSDHREDVYAA